VLLLCTIPGQESDLSQGKVKSQALGGLSELDVILDGVRSTLWDLGHYQTTRDVGYPLENVNTKDAEKSACLECSPVCELYGGHFVMISSLAV
jgi:hypothetical protein